MTLTSFQPTLTYAQNLDREDKLSHFRSEFYRQPNCIYLDGNSLGLLSKRAERTALNVIEDWKRFGIDGWAEGNNPWFYLSEELGKVCSSFIGASVEEVIITGSATVNLHQLIATFYRPEGKKTKILMDELAFPSDIYAVQSQLLLRGYDPSAHLIRVRSREERFLSEDDIISAMTDEVALIILPTVLYRSGQLLNIERLTAAAHKRGALIGFDGCHSVGVIPHHFNEWDVDFACWCNYKYLNGGPGCTGGLYVNRKHFGTMPGLAGWFGSKKDVQFDMEHAFIPAQTAGAYQIGTPHILSLGPLIGSFQMIEEAGIENIRAKSLNLTQYTIYLIEYELSSMGFTIGSPREGSMRGGHISLEHVEAVRICKALKQEGIVPDFRPPHIIRLAPVPLYNSYSEVWKVVQTLREIMCERRYEIFTNERDVIA